jgi:hypothetical protein
LDFCAAGALAYAGHGLLEAQAPSAKIPTNSAIVANLFMFLKFDF